MLPSVFASFPKTRPPLPPEIQEIYIEFYKINRTGESGISAASQWLESWMHRIIAKKGIRFPNAQTPDSIIRAPLLIPLHHPLSDKILAP
jgi:hypothetical protein